MTWKILFAIIMGKDPLFKHRKYQSVWVNRPNKVIEAIKNIFFKNAVSYICRKFEFLVSHGSVGACLR